MIRSDADYRDAIARSRKSAERLVNYREELRGQGLSPEEVERAVGFAVNLLDDLNGEIGSYERIKNGDLSGFKTLRDIGELLIAARLACGLGQRELAVRLGIHESQVSRDEKNEYQGVSGPRAGCSDPRSARDRCRNPAKRSARRSSGRGGRPQYVRTYAAV